MAREEQLPKFRNPPVIEVVHGVQFRTLPLTIAHPGLFFAAIRDRYPTTATVMPLPPHRETFDGGSWPPAFRFEFMPASQLPRAWFVSEDDTMLVQLQQDRFHLNWRRGMNAANYPSFEGVTAEFGRVFGELERFVQANQLPEIVAEQCEVTYINHFPPAHFTRPPMNPEQFLRTWRNEPGPEWTVETEDLSFTVRYVLRGDGGVPFGRLTATLSPVGNPTTGDRRYQMELTARGAPTSPDLLGVLAFHRDAHEQLVRCFAGLTTPSAHAEWERVL